MLLQMQTAQKKAFWYLFSKQLWQNQFLDHSTLFFPEVLPLLCNKHFKAPMWAFLGTQPSFHTPKQYSRHAGLSQGKGHRKITFFPLRKIYLMQWSQDMAVFGLLPQKLSDLWRHNIIQSITSAKRCPGRQMEPQTTTELSVGTHLMFNSIVQ